MSGLTFKAEDHTYAYDGVPVPGVTTILSPLTDFSGIPRSVLENAAMRGTAVHKAVELHLLGDLDEGSMHPEVAARFYQFLRFVRETGFDPIVNEEFVYHDKYRYAGQLDLVGEVRGRLSVVDLKCTFVFPPSAGPQTAAYEAAYRQTHFPKKRPLPRYALQLKKDRYVFHQLPNERDFAVFRACLSIHNWRVENGK